MTDLTEQELIRIVHRYYPTGSFAVSDSYTQEVPPYTRTAEHQRWMEAWKQAMEWPAWDSLLEELDIALGSAGDVTQPYMAACRRCSRSEKQPLPDGAQLVTRAIAAVSVLAPLYVTYCITETVGPRSEPLFHHFSFEPTDDVKPHFVTLARTIERVLGYRPFPLHLHNVLVPEVFVPHLGGEQATLLYALFDKELHNLP
ncbi:hypothetical protein [Hyalangium sp.]|uniref:hypothetical protein n=1 Tax=Hyalangium sp. TaxID=2028555 RepID=UPI002D6999A4|nr:hypothetical protein [Hyalangium sp.]HYH96716.1 hypothetical protein [Hyalangium sp.]